MMYRFFVIEIVIIGIHKCYPGIKSITVWVIFRIVFQLIGLCLRGRMICSVQIDIVSACVLVEVLLLQRAVFICIEQHGFQQRCGLTVIFGIIKVQILSARIIVQVHAACYRRICNSVICNVSKRNCLALFADIQTCNSLCGIGGGLIAYIYIVSAAFHVGILVNDRKALIGQLLLSISLFACSCGHYLADVLGCFWIHDLIHIDIVSAGSIIKIPSLAV